MRTIAVVPVKSLGAAKRRLSSTLGGGSRQLLAQAMFSDVLAALRRAERLDAIAVVTDDHEVQAMLHGDPVIVLDDDRSEGQSAAAEIGLRHALSHGYPRALLVPGDTPLVDPAAVDELLEKSRTEQLAVAIVPDRHGHGTNALVIRPPDAFAPSFGPDSLERHLQAARTTELPHQVIEVESLMHDVDTEEDLTALGEKLEQLRGVAPRTRGALRQLHRMRAASVPTVALEEVPSEESADEPARARDSAVWHPTREGAPADRRAAWA